MNNANRTMKTLVKVAVLLVVGTTLFGCASLPSASPDTQRRALDFSAPEGKASVYIYRPSSIVLGADTFHVSLDYKKAGSVLNNMYIFGFISPGQHTLRAATGVPGEQIRPARFTVEPGKVYFFAVSPNDNRAEIHESSDTEGRRAVKTAKLSGANLLDTQ
jgi:hypothetical protein